MWQQTHYATALLCLCPPPLPHSFCPPHVVSVLGVCLFGFVLIADACVFGLCWLGGERARCRADGVPSAPCGPAVPSSLLSHRERRADRLLQGEHHFLSPSLSLALTYTQRGCILTPHQLFYLPPPISQFSSFLTHFFLPLFQFKYRL